MEPLLEMATKYKVLNVKKYCEQHLLWRDDFKFSKTRKFRLACEHNLNHIVKDLLKYVKDREHQSQLIKYASRNTRDINIYRLLLTKSF
ncbi:unnamed protein product [Caenorhabditis brenneri]